MATATTTRPVSGVVTQLLRNFSPIHANGRFANHMPHALVALDRLGASSARIKEWAEGYAKRAPQKELPPSEHRVNRANWLSFRGKQEAYPDLLEFFQKETERLGDSRKVVREYLPQLVEGEAGQALHGIILLGYCSQIGEPWLISSGLAYLTYCYMSLGKLGELGANDSRTGKGSSISVSATDQGEQASSADSKSESKSDGESSFVASPLSPHLESAGSIEFKMPLNEHKLLRVLDIVRADDELPAFPKEADGFTTRMRWIGSDAKMRARLARYDLPMAALAATVRHSSSFKEDSHAVTVDELSTLVIKTALEVYAQTGCQDFFLLHGVTAAEALRQSLKFAFGDDSAASVDMQLTSLAAMWRTLVAAFCARGRPKFDDSFKKESKQPDWETDWDDIIKKATTKTEDAHRIKLAYVCHAMAAEQREREWREDPLWSLAARSTLAQSEWQR